MNSSLLLAGCIALGALGAWNTYTLVEVSKRLDAIEQMSLTAAKSAQTTATSRAAVYQQGSAEAPSKARLNTASSASSTNSLAAEQRPGQPSLDLTDPEIQEKIARIAESNAQKKEEQRRKSKREAYSNSIKYELEKFSNEKEYDAETAQSIETILNDSTAEWRAVREQVRDGEISWIDARTEFRAIGEDTKEKATEYISEEDYKELRSRLWGDWGR